MARGIDAVLQELSGGMYDAKIGFDGDFETADFFDTSILVSLLSDRRANEAEVPESHRRRGWIGNEYTPGFEGGSKLWLFEQSRLSGTVMNAIADAARDALEWLVDDGLAVAIRNVSVEFAPPSSPVTGVRLVIEIQRSTSQVERQYFDLWQNTGVAEAVDPVGAIIPPAHSPQTTSIDFDGATESMRSVVTQPFGIENSFTFGVWWKPRAASFTSISEIFLVKKSGGGVANRISLTLEGTTANDPVEVFLRSGGDGIFKTYLWDNLATVDDWNFTLFTWDGTDLTLYHDGSLVVESSRSVDDPGTMIEENREIRISGNAGSASLDGMIHSIGVWNAVLPNAAQAALHNGGNGRDVDWRNGAPFCGYLQHWWRLGHDPDDLGKDYGRAADLIDVNELSTGITSADIVSDSPQT